ncbi:MAG: hypothetical protein HRT74_01700 [Flavobacteriales bacterium]|nr:hypothetical protein [Flavobacteriales bacterium]
MKENRFLKKYESKSDTDLEAIIKDTETFTKEARMAAIQLLNQRHGQTEFSERAQDQIEENELKQKVQIERIISDEVLKESGFETNDLNAPELYSKSFIGLSAILFSTLFAGILLLMNLKKAEKKDGRVPVIFFSSLYTLGAMILLDSIGPVSSLLVLVVNSLAGLILTHLLLNRFLGKEIRYRKRSIIWPVLIGVTIQLIILAFVLFSRTQ